MDQVRSLRVFVQVVAAGSFAGAARVLDMAPAGVTRAVAELEAHLGARLLHRTTRSLALTEIGEAYLDRARQLLTELDEADALAGAQTQRPEGVLRVLCPPAFAAHQLALNLPAFRAQYPGIALELSTPGPVEAADENFDISILSLGAQPLQGDFVARPLAQSSFVLCAAPAYLAQRGRPAEPEDLAAHDGVLPAVAAVRRELTLYRQVPDDREGAVNKVSLSLPRPAALHQPDRHDAGRRAGGAGRRRVCPRLWRPTPCARASSSACCPPGAAPHCACMWPCPRDATCLRARGCSADFLLQDVWRPGQATLGWR
jgi:DNA-binding transcriptional LysR family regulator